MRLGDLDAIEKFIEDGLNNPDKEKAFGHDAIEILAEVHYAPTIDAVPVVRCGECEKRSKSADLTYTIYCPWLGQQMDKNDFCSYGERKDGNT